MWPMPPSRAPKDLPVIPPLTTAALLRSEFALLPSNVAEALRQATDEAAAQNVEAGDETPETSSGSDSDSDSDEEARKARRDSRRNAIKIRQEWLTRQAHGDGAIKAFRSAVRLDGTTISGCG